MKSILRTPLVLGIALLLATVAGAETHVGDWDVTGEITASGNFATFGSDNYVTPFFGWSGSSRMVAVRQPNPVSSGVSAGFMFSNNQTGNAQNIAQLMFLNEAIGAAEKRVAQILVTTGGSVNSGKMYFRVFDGGSATNALTINRFGTVTVGDGLTFPDGETQTTAFMGATGGGPGNTATGLHSTVGGGADNIASAQGSAIGAGVINLVTDNYGTVSGGYDNQAGDDAGTSSDAGYATVGGGESNTASGLCSTVAGGGNNIAIDQYATVGGGWYNEVQADYATIAGGGPSDEGNPSTTNNVVTDGFGTIGGGGGNQAGDNAGTTSDAGYATVGGGSSNIASGGWSTVSGGDDNTASNSCATVAGGMSNSASGGWSTVGGGYANFATSINATVPGGWGNTASGGYSFAAGRLANASHDNSFVWGDTDGGGSAAANTFNIHASNGVYLNGALHAASDRNKKENFKEVDAREVLEKVADIRMSTWSYKREDGGIRHMGPMGQDFYAAFALGTDGKHITTVDADGVALAAIQGLYKAGQEKDARIATQQERIEVLESKLEAVEALVTNLMEN
jgi:hypothetical protein